MSATPSSPVDGQRTKEELKKAKLRAAKAKLIAKKKRLARARAAAAGKGQGKKIPKGKRYEVKKWNGVCLWAYGGDEMTLCAICRNEIMEMCIECQANDTSTSNSDW